MSSPATAIAPEAAQPSKSFMERFIGVFISPGETFADIARKPDFIVPLVVMTILTAIGMEIFLAKIGLDGITRYAIEHSSRGANMSADQVNQAVSAAVPIQKIVFHIIGVIYVPIICLIGALVGMIIVNSIFGGEIPFKTALAIPSYANLISIVGSVIATLLVFFGDPEHFASNPGNPMPTTVGFFMNPADISKPLLALASSFDLFTLWYLALLGIGFSQASGKKASTGAVFGCIFGVWLVWVVIKVGLSTLGG